MVSPGIASRAIVATVFLFLPADHSWNVEIHQREEGIGARFEDVDIPERKAGDRWPKLELEVPETSVFGHIRRADGQPVVGRGEVMVSDEESSIRVEARDDGSFRARGPRPGGVRLQASLEVHGEVLRSEVTRVELAEGAPQGPLDLVLREETVLSGFVYSPSGQGVAGTRVVATLGQTGLSAHLRDAYTDVEGVFEIRLPASAASVQLALFPPGFAATQLRVQLPVDEPVLVPVDEASGRVTIAFEEPPATFDERRLKWGVRLSKDSLFVGTVHVLAPWASLHGVTQPRDRLVVPRVAPGRYTACFEPEIAAGLQGGADTRCVSGELGVGGDLHLTIPSTPFEPEGEADAPS